MASRQLHPGLRDPLRTPKDTDFAVPEVCLSTVTFQGSPPRLAPSPFLGLGLRLLLGFFFREFNSCP